MRECGQRRSRSTELAVHAPGVAGGETHWQDLIAGRDDLDAGCAAEALRKHGRQLDARVTSAHD